MNVKINIITKQYDENNNLDKLNFEFNGKIIDKNNKLHIIYKEENITNKISVDILNKEITSVKVGIIDSKMTFIEDKEDFIKYKTNYGLFDMKIYTNEIDIKENKEGIIITINYDLEVKNLFKGKNILEINVKKVFFL